MSKDGNLGRKRKQKTVKMLKSQKRSHKLHRQVYKGVKADQQSCRFLLFCSVQEVLRKIPQISFKHDAAIPSIFHLFIYSNLLYYMAFACKAVCWLAGNAPTVYRSFRMGLLLCINKHPRKRVCFACSGILATINTLICKFTHLACRHMLTCSLKHK